MTPTPSPSRSARSTIRTQTERTRWDRRSRRAEASYLAQARTQLNPRTTRTTVERRPA